MLLVIFKVIVILWIIHIVMNPSKHKLRKGFRPLKNKGNSGGGAGGFG